MKIDWKRAIFAGLLGTLAFDVLGLLLTGQWWDVPGLLGMKLGTGLAGGVVVHYTNGAVLAIIYAGIAPSLWGPHWVRALTYIADPPGIGATRRHFSAASSVAPDRHGMGSDPDCLPRASGTP